jgi:hypothetical protein
VTRDNKIIILIIIIIRIIKSCVAHTERNAHVGVGKRRKSNWRSNALVVITMKLSEKCYFLSHFGVYYGKEVSEENPAFISITEVGFTQTTE